MYLTGRCNAPCPALASRARSSRKLLVQASATPVTPLPPSLDKELRGANYAVRLASKLCRTVQSQLSLSDEKTDKKDDSPVTIADYGAQVVVAWALSQRTDGRLSMVAEEDSAQLRVPEGQAMLQRITDLVNSSIAGEPGAVQLSMDDVINLIDLGASEGGPSGHHWVLDPIDGTRGFVGKRQYSVCLGLLQDGQVTLGALGCPNLPQGIIDQDTGAAGADGRTGRDIGSLFYATRGQGAYAEPLYQQAGTPGAQPPQRIYVDDLTDFSTAQYMESFESRHSNHSLTAQVASAVGVVRPSLRMDSQVKYGLLSRGAASIFMRFPPASYREKIWDHAPGFVIVEEAGGLVTDAAGTRLDFSQGRYLALDRGIIAAPPKLHAALIKAVNEISPK